MCCNTQWDRRLKEVLQRLDTAQPNGTFNEEIDFLLRSAADTTVKSPQPSMPIAQIYGSTQASITGDFAWIKNPFVSPEIQKQLHSFVDTGRPFNNFYLRLGNSTSSTVQSFINELSENNSLPSVHDRILCLARLWNFVQYHYPYKNLLDRNWNIIIEEFLPKFIASGTEKEYISTILNLRSFLQDPHSFIRPQHLSTVLGKYRLPLSLKYVEGKVVIHQTDAQLGVKRGNIVTMLNGEPIDSIIQRLTYYVSASNEAVKYREIVEGLLLFSINSTATIELLNGNDTSRIVLDCPAFDKYKYSLKNNASPPRPFMERQKNK